MDGHRHRLLGVALLGAVLLAGCSASTESPPASTTEATTTGTTTDATAGGEPKVSTITTDLEAPWGLAFLPDGRAVVSSTRAHARAARWISPRGPYLFSSRACAREGSRAGALLPARTREGSPIPDRGRAPTRPSRACARR